MTPTQAMTEVGYAPGTVNTPADLVASKGFIMLMDAAGLNDTNLVAAHSRLLNSTTIEHMTFPLGPEGADHPVLSGAKANDNGNEVDSDAPAEAALPNSHKERTSLTDVEIVDMLKDVNCKVKRIVHGQTARHVYFWAQDNKALKDGLDMAYKLKGHYTDREQPPTVQNNFYLDNPTIRIAVASIDQAMKAQILKTNETPQAIQPTT